MLSTLKSGTMDGLCLTTLKAPDTADPICCQH